MAILFTEPPYNLYRSMFCNAKRRLVGALTLSVAGHDGWCREEIEHGR